MNLLKYIGFVKRGKNRMKIFLALNTPMLPSELTKKVFGKASNTYFNITSRSLRELKNMKFVEIVNPNETMGRIYKKTQLGEKIERELLKLNN